MFSEVAADWSFHIPAPDSHLLVSLHHRSQSQKVPKSRSPNCKDNAAVETRGSPPGAGTLTQLSATDHSATVEAERGTSRRLLAELQRSRRETLRLSRSNHRGSRHWRRRHTHIPRSHRQQVKWGRAVHVELHFLGSEYVSSQQFF